MKQHKQKNKKKFNPLRYIAVGGTFVLVIILVLCLNAAINKQIKVKEDELLTLQEEIKVEEAATDELNKVLNYSDEEYLQYVIGAAHDQDLVRQGERVFEIVSGG